MTDTNSYSRRTASLGIVCAFALSLIPIHSVSASVSSSSWVPRDPPSIYDLNAGPNATSRRDPQLEICTTDTQLDCLESVEASINNIWVTGTFTGRMGYAARGAFGTTEWKIPGLYNEDGKDLVEVRNEIQYNGNIVHSIDIFGTSLDDFRPAWESGRTTSDCALMNDVCVRYGNLQADIPFRVTYRSSWVLPTALSSKLANTELTVEKLSQSGATRVTIAGTPLEYVGVADDLDVTSPDGEGAWISREFTAGMIDGRFYQRLKRDCIEKSTFTVSNNAYGYALPEFRDGKLDLMVQAPHFRPRRQEKHMGIYEAVIPLETAQCLWGSTISEDSVFAVDVVSPETGLSKLATPSFAFTSTGFLISARDFTYSTPTIRVSPLPRPKKPGRVSLSAGRGTLSATFTAVKGTKYSATATKGTVTKKLKCKTAKKKVTCSVKKLKKGTWRVSIVATKNQIKSIPYTKQTRVK